MAIIKLTGEKTGRSFYVNSKYIESLHINENTTELFLAWRDRIYFVKETPEEILALIKEAENGNK